MGFDWEEVKQRGLDVIVAIDTSKSMLAEDIAPNRLKRAKLASLDLMQQAKSDRLEQLNSSDTGDIILVERRRRQIYPARAEGGTCSPNAFVVFGGADTPS